MRNGNEWMPEEINRVACNHVSNILFAYHPDNRDNMIRENISTDRIHVVGNTIVEICKPFVEKYRNVKKREDCILVDIHRSENIGVGSLPIPENKLKNIIKYVNQCVERYRIPAKMLKFPRTIRVIEKMNIDLGKIELIELMGYNDYMDIQYHSKFMISDSGTSHEEPAILRTPVTLGGEEHEVPRLYTERPQSIVNYCSILLNTEKEDLSWQQSHLYLQNYWDGTIVPNLEWLGDGETATRIVEIIANLKEGQDEE